MARKRFLKGRGKKDSPGANKGPRTDRQQKPSSTAKKGKATNNPRLSKQKGKGNLKDPANYSSLPKIEPPKGLDKPRSSKSKSTKQTTIASS